MGRPCKTEEEKKANRAAHARKNYHKVKKYRSEKLECECGAMVCRVYLSDHKKKAKHLDSMKYINLLRSITEI